MSEAEEIKLFDAPDLAQLQRNWPRIALRLGILALVPFFVTMLAKSLDLYNTITNLPLPLDFLARGPFAYEAKAIFFVVAVLIGLAFLVPKRTTQLVMAICVGGILWTGHVYIQLQWARLFATSFHFRTDAMPGPLAWMWATLLMMAGVSFLMVENLLDTRQQQTDRKLSGEDAAALFDVGWRTIGAFLGIGAAFAAALVGAYLLLRVALTGVALPFRLNPVFVLLGMGICLAVLVAIAVRRQSPLAAGAAPAVVSVPVQARAPDAPPALTEPHVPAGDTSPAQEGWWRAMRAAERVAFVAAALAVPVLFLPWTFFPTSFGVGASQPGFTDLAGITIGIAAVGTLATYPGRKRNAWRRFGVPALWLVPIPTFVLLVENAQTTGPYLQPAAFLGFVLWLAALGSSASAAFSRRVPP